jgi:hypothetical protein
MATKFIPFEEVEELATIERLAQMLNLDIRRSGAQWRCECPAHPGHHRDLCISPQVKSKRGSLGVFFCQREKQGGDRIGLVAHVMDIGQQDAALFIAQQFGMEIAKGINSTSKLGTVPTVCEERATPPPAREKAATTRETTRAEFDPLAFLAKLEYTEEVAATGLSEEDAKDLGVGFYRGKLYQAVRWQNGDIAAFTHPDGDSLKFPKTLVRPREAKIVMIPKRA